MPKAIHFINVRKGSTLRNLSKGKEDNQWETSRWKITQEQANALENGYVYLHETKKKLSSFGGQITNIRQCNDEPKRWIISFYNKLECQGKSWRGQAYPRAWTSGIVDADQPYEK